MPSCPGQLARNGLSVLFAVRAVVATPPGLLWFEASCVIIRSCEMNWCGRRIRIYSSIVNHHVVCTERVQQHPQSQLKTEAGSIAMKPVPLSYLMQALGCFSRLLRFFRWCLFRQQFGNGTTRLDFAGQKNGRKKSDSPRGVSVHKVNTNRPSWRNGQVRISALARPHQLVEGECGAVVGASVYRQVDAWVGRMNIMAVRSIESPPVWDIRNQQSLGRVVARCAGFASGVWEVGSCRHVHPRLAGLRSF